MILIISENGDYTTDKVIDWITYLKSEFLRINDSDFFLIENITIKNQTVFIRLSSPSIEICFDEIKSYWHRRGFLNIISKGNNSMTEIEVQDQGIHKYLISEIKSLYSFIINELYSKPGFGRIEDNFTNKVFNLSIAMKSGLIVPETFVIEDKDYLCNLMDKSPLITKSVDISYFNNNGIKYGFYTNEIKKEDIINVPDNFGLSLVQHKLKKKYELRIFYLNGFVFVNAIFSQNDSQTSTDFRRYNYSKPNRSVPFNLPKKIQNKINKFMSIKKLKSGSIDIVVTSNNDFVFLEVNPFGQFDQVSRPGNFFIERLIAENLIKLQKIDEK
jgi:ATP-GRASP peptide maturase of grasp-with-spasm system